MHGKGVLGLATETGRFPKAPCSRKNLAALPCIHLFHLVDWQGKNKFCPYPFGTDDIDIFIMCQDNFLYNGEAEPGSLLILSP